MKGLFQLPFPLKSDAIKLNYSASNTGWSEWPKLIERFHGLKIFLSAFNFACQASFTSSNIKRIVIQNKAWRTKISMQIKEQS